MFVPFTLPGERVSVRQVAAGRAELIEVLAGSPDRVTPPCPHFGPCGGCALQHWSDPAQSAWKARRGADALARAGFAVASPRLLRVPADSRRRMDLALRRTPSGVTVGLHGRRSHDVVAIPHCRVLHPALHALLGPLAATLSGLDGLRRGGSLLLTLLDTGPDLLLRHDAPLTAADRQRLARFAQAHRIPRIAAARGDGPPETACQLAPVGIAFAGTTVRPPAAPFLQAAAQGEAAIVAAVLDGVAGLRPNPRIVELFAGIGTLSLPLATIGRVTAYEGDADAATALASAAIGRLRVQRRDLARQPLAAAEFARVDLVVLDPPFGGAAEQMAALATARPPRITYVSCNPAALARDAAGLAGAGYRVHDAQAIDQFVWSPHVETVVHFRRE